MSPREQRRNFRLGVVNGAVFRITLTCIDSETVLAWFLTQLGASNPLIGLVSPVRMGSSFLFQILVSGYLQQRPFKLPFCRTMGILRCVVLVAMALVIALVPVHSPWLVGTFFLLLIAYSMGAGLTGLPFMDVVGKVVPPTRRGRFFGLRAFWGGLLTLGTSAFIGLTGHRWPHLFREMLDYDFAWDTFQFPANLLDAHYRSFTREILPLARARGIGVIGMKSLSGGRRLQTGISAQEAIRYVLPLPIDNLVSGIDSLDLLARNLDIVRAWTPITGQERDQLLERAAPFAADGHLEHCKQTN